MRSTLGLIRHYLRETALLFGTNRISSIMSLLSTVLVFLFLGSILVGTRITGHWMTMVLGEAEIQVFPSNEQRMESLHDDVRLVSGVEEVLVVDAEAAKARMEMLLGGEAEIMTYLEENPFRPFLEVRLTLSKVDLVLAEISEMDGVERIVDNRDVLEQLYRLDTGLQRAGIVISLSVALFTFVLLSHMTRAGVVHHREQIRTLRLLGAPEWHLALPFLFLGVLMGAGGALVASTVLTVLVRNGFHSGEGILFLPLPAVDALLDNLFLLTGVAGVVLGLLGTGSGLLSSRARKHGRELI